MGIYCDKTAAVVNGQMITVACVLIAHKQHSTIKDCMDRCAFERAHVQSGVSLALAGEGISSVTKFRDDHAAPVFTEGRTEAIHAGKGCIGQRQSVYPRIKFFSIGGDTAAVVNAVVNLLSVGLFLISDGPAKGALKVSVNFRQ